MPVFRYWVEQQFMSDYTNAVAQNKQIMLLTLIDGNKARRIRKQLQGRIHRKLLRQSERKYFYQAIQNGLSTQSG